MSTHEHDVVGLTDLLGRLRRVFPVRPVSLGGASFEEPGRWPEAVTEQAQVVTRAVCEVLRATDEGASP